MARRIEFKRPQSAQPPDPLSSADPPPTQHTHPTLSIVATETIQCTLKKTGHLPSTRLLPSDPSLNLVVLITRNSSMTDPATYPVPAHFGDAHITPERYQSLYQQSLRNPTFSGQSRRKCSTGTRPGNTFETDLRTGAASWFVGRKLNVSVNCIDRHLPEPLMTLPSFGRETTQRQPDLHLPTAQRSCLPFRQCAESTGVGRGPRMHLHAHDPEAALPCWPARVLAPSTRWYSAAFPRGTERSHQ